MDPVAATEVENHDHDQRGHRGQQGAGQRLVQALVDHPGGQRRVLAPHLADPIEDDNGVIERIADDGQEGGDHRQVDLEVLQHQHAAIHAHFRRRQTRQRDTSQHNQYVVHQGDDRREAKVDPLEPEPDVGHDRHQAEEHRQYGRLLHLVGHRTVE